MSAEKLTQLQEKAQTDLVMVRQSLDDALSQEKRAMRCGLVKKRRELISDMVWNIIFIFIYPLSCKYCNLLSASTHMHCILRESK